MLLAFTATAIAAGFAVRWHRASTRQYIAIQRLRPYTNVYFDHMVEWDGEFEMFRSASGDIFKLQPRGVERLLYEVLHEDYACRPSMLVMLDLPPEAIECVAQLPSVKQIVVYPNDQDALKEWAAKFPNISVVSKREFNSE